MVLRERYIKQNATMNLSLLQTAPLKRQREWTGEELQKGKTQGREGCRNTCALLLA